MFPANIVGVNRTLFLPEESPALSVFIAWVNLDFGIEACFHDGMDAYTKTWLQFVFVLVGLMVLISHFKLLIDLLAEFHSHANTGHCSQAHVHMHAVMDINESIQNYITVKSSQKHY